MLQVAVIELLADFVKKTKSASGYVHLTAHRPTVLFSETSLGAWSRNARILGLIQRAVIGVPRFQLLTETAAYELAAENLSFGALRKGCGTGAERGATPNTLIGSQLLCLPRR